MRLQSECSVGLERDFFEHNLVLILSRLFFFLFHDVTDTDTDTQTCDPSEAPLKKRPAMMHGHQAVSKLFLARPSAVSEAKQTTGSFEQLLVIVDHDDCC